MRITKTLLNKILIKKLAKNKKYQEALGIAKMNSTGKIWLIGGSVCRPLLEEIYGFKQKGYDLDFFVENINKKMIVPKGWTQSKNWYGVGSFTKRNIEMDLFPIKKHHYIKKNKLEPKIENFLIGVQFTIQSLAFDIQEQKLIGKIGIDAIRKREFKVNNLKEASRIKKFLRITINQRIEQKAKSLGLKPVYVKE